MGQYETQIKKHQKEFNLKDHHQFYLAYQYYEKSLPFAINHKAFKVRKETVSKSGDYVFSLLSKECVNNTERFYYVEPVASRVDMGTMLQQKPLFMWMALHIMQQMAHCI